jgi:hypothetical protein
MIFGEVITSSPFVKGEQRRIFADAYNSKLKTTA